MLLRQLHVAITAKRRALQAGVGTATFSAAQLLAHCEESGKLSFVSYGSFKIFPQGTSA
jgi:hypothetical protein